MNRFILFLIANALAWPIIGGRLLTKPASITANTFGFPVLSGDWTGNFSTSTHDCGYPVTVHIDQTNDNLTGAITYALPHQKFVRWYFIGTVGMDSSIQLREQRRPGALATNELANNSDLKFTGAVSSTMSNFTCAGQWSNENLNPAEIGSYISLPNCKTGLFTFSRNKAVQELLAASIAQDIAAWGKQEKYETDADHNARIGNTTVIAELQDAMANRFYNIYRAGHPFTLTYDKTAQEFSVSADGTETLRCPVKITEADCFETAFNDRSVNNKVVFAWNATTEKAVIDSFYFKIICHEKEFVFKHPNK